MARRAGPKPKLTPALQDAIAHAVSQGIPLFQAGLLGGVSGATAQEWYRRGCGTDDRLGTPLYQAFATAIDTAKAQDEARRLRRITQAAEGGSIIAEKTVTHAGSGQITREVKYKVGEWTADAWVLERTRPETYALKTRVDLQVTIQQIAAKLAAEMGLTPDAILAEAHLLLQEADHGRAAD
jgi:hypothetical protein